MRWVKDGWDGGDQEGERQAKTSRGSSWTVRLESDRKVEGSADGERKRDEQTGGDGEKKSAQADG